MNIERMNELVRFLESLPEDRLFDMSIYGYYSIYESDQRFCGCAIGWATLNPFFNEQGFVHKKSLDIGVYPVFRHQTDSNRSLEGSAATMHFFELNSEDTFDLFGGA